LQRPLPPWPLHDIALANIVLCLALKRGVRRGAYIARYEHGNDFVFYSAVEKDSLIASLWQ